MPNQTGKIKVEKVSSMITKMHSVLRDEIGMCPNIKVEIDVMDNSPFFRRPFHAKEEDKAILDKEMKRLCYLGILRKAFLLTQAQLC